MFYCKPKTEVHKDDKVWYCNSPIGHNLLARKLKDMFTDAGLNTENIIVCVQQVSVDFIPKVSQRKL